MTALKKYQKLECTGLWRESPTDQRREVRVQFGEATLILSDPKSDTAVSHWSLPAVERANSGNGPAVFGPGTDAGETVEISDPDMIAALESVHSAVQAAIARPGRLRTILLVSATAILLGLGLFWVPSALVSHTAAVVPSAKRAEIGQQVLDDLSQLTGAPCDNQLGLRALAGISDRVFGSVDTPILYVMPDGVDRALSMPGDVIVLPRRLTENPAGPEALAGAALVEGLHSKLRDPLIPLLDYAGLRATFQLLTTGDLPETAIRGYGEAMLRSPLDTLDTDTVLKAFKDAQIPSTPYGFAIDATGTSTSGLIGGDPYKGLSPTPLVPDDEWIALQSICSA